MWGWTRWHGSDNANRDDWRITTPAILHWFARFQLIASEVRGATMVVTAPDSSSTDPHQLARQRLPQASASRR